MFRWNKVALNFVIFLTLNTTYFSNKINYIQLPFQILGNLYFSGTIICMDEVFEFSTCGNQLLHAK